MLMLLSGGSMAMVWGPEGVGAEYVSATRYWNDNHKPEHAWLGNMGGAWVMGDGSPIVDFFHVRFSVMFVLSQP